MLACRRSNTFPLTKLDGHRAVTVPGDGDKSAASRLFGVGQLSTAEKWRCWSITSTTPCAVSLTPASLSIGRECPIAAISLMRIARPSKATASECQLTEMRPRSSRDPDDHCRPADRIILRPLCALQRRTGKKLTAAASLPTLSARGLCLARQEAGKGPATGVEPPVEPGARSRERRGYGRD